MVRKNLFDLLRFGPAQTKIVETPELYLFFLFVKRMGSHMLQESETDSLTRKEILDYFNELKRDPDNPIVQIKAFSDYWYNVNTEKIIVSKRTVHNILKRLMVEGTLPPPTKISHKIRLYRLPAPLRRTIKNLLAASIDFDKRKRIDLDLQSAIVEKQKDIPAIVKASKKL